MYFTFSGCGSLKKALREIRQGKHNDNECEKNCEANKKFFNCKLYKCPFIDSGNETTKLLEQVSTTYTLRCKLWAKIHELHQLC